jgi:phage terminase large subunit-like protein
MLFDAILELQKNPRILADYGELYNVKRNSEELTQKKISNFLTNNGIRVEAHSTQESIRGRLHGAQRPDALILDDFETNKTKDSEAYTNQVANHISEAQSGMDAQGIVLYLCNYITEYGNVNRLFERSKDDKRLKVRKVDVIMDGKPSWEAKYCLTTEEAEKTGKVSIEDIRKKLGPQVFNSEMMNMPIDDSTQEFLSSWFKTIKRSEVLLKNTRKYALIDSAMSKGSDSDNSGISRVYVDQENKWYVSGKKYRVNAKSLIDLLFQLHDEGMEQIGIETTAYSEGIKPYFEEECRKRNKYPRVVELKHGGVQKETRIRGLIPRYSNGDIYHIEGECDDLENELLRFPRSKHDDVMDSLAYAPQICQKPYDTSRFQQEDSIIYNDINL